jgi:CDP-diacylglycerol---glycerol-3-phosphate 3-phosphatidyltransferase
VKEGRREQPEGPPRRRGWPDPVAEAEVDPDVVAAEEDVEPSWANPANALTLLRVALVPVIAVLLILDGDTARWWAFGIFVFAALTDSIDGWVARKMIGVTRWGQLADPAADKALIVGSLAILAYLERLPWWAVAVIVVREVAVTLLRTLLMRRGVVMPASIFGKAKTVSQVVAVTLYLLPGAPADLREVVLWIAVIATVASGLEYAARGKRLRRAG